MRVKRNNTETCQEYHIQEPPHGGIFGMHPFNTQATTEVETVSLYYVFAQKGQRR